MYDGTTIQSPVTTSQYAALLGKVPLPFVGVCISTPGAVQVRASHATMGSDRCVTNNCRNDVRQQDVSLSAAAMYGQSALGDGTCLCVAQNLGLRRVLRGLQRQQILVVEV